VSARIVMLSGDRKEIIIKEGERQMTLRSRRPDGFTDEQVTQASGLDFSRTGEEGQTSTAWLKQWRGWEFYLWKGTGPPTWWWPRVNFGPVKGPSIGIGWLRLALTVAVRRVEGDE
jgi:hypothetical protein